MAGRLTFDFITDEEFRTALEGDARELDACMENAAWKAVHVVAGSIVEAVLVEYLVGAGKTKPDPLTMTLGPLIDACHKEGVLSQKTAELSAALKSYRNLIHPGRAMRLGEKVDADSAIVARSLVSIVVREVSATQQQQYGLTAEQILTKFESDPTALGISEHLLKEARDREIERLLLRVLPDRYFDEVQLDYPDLSILDGHKKLFRAAFDMAPDSVKKKVMERFVTVLREEAGPRVQAYEEEFFQASDLKYLKKADRELVKAHLFARLKTEPSMKLLAVTRDIGAWLTEDDVIPFVDALVRVAVLTRNERLAVEARSVLGGEAMHTPTKLDPMIVARLQTWEQSYARRDREDHAAILREVIADYEAWADIPF